MHGLSLLYSLGEDGMDERDIATLERYMDKCLFEPSLGWFKDAFDMQVYSRWVANEILERMTNEAMKLPEHISGVERRSASEIVDEFIDELECAYSGSRNHDTKFIFFIALDAAKSIRALYTREENHNG